jgi:hypothetical protein
MADRLVSELKAMSRPFEQEQIELSDTQQRARVLETARSAIAATLKATLCYEDASVELKLSNWSPVDLVPPDLSVEVVIHTRVPEFRSVGPSQLTADWNDVRADEFTECVCWKISDNSPTPAAPISWVQKADVQLPQSVTLASLREKRDAALLRRLGFEELCDLISAELAGFPVIMPRGKRKKRREGFGGERELVPQSLRLEELLRHRIRNVDGWRPEFIQQISRAIDSWESVDEGISIDQINQLRTLWQPFAKAFGTSRA